MSENRLPLDSFKDSLDRLPERLAQALREGMQQEQNMQRQRALGQLFGSQGFTARFAAGWNRQEAFQEGIDRISGGPQKRRMLAMQAKKFLKDQERAERERERQSRQNAVNQKRQLTKIIKQRQARQRARVRSSLKHNAAIAARGRKAAAAAKAAAKAAARQAKIRQRQLAASLPKKIRQPGQPFFKPRTRSVPFNRITPKPPAQKTQLAHPNQQSQQQARATQLLTNAMNNLATQLQHQNAQAGAGRQTQVQPPARTTNLPPGQGPIQGRSMRVRTVTARPAPRRGGF